MLLSTGQYTSRDVQCGGGLSHYEAHTTWMHQAYKITQWCYSCCAQIFLIIHRCSACLYYTLFSLAFFTAFHFLVETVLAGVSPHYLSIALLFSVIVTPLGFKKAVWSIALHVARGFQGGNQKNGFVVVKKHHPRCILIKLGDSILQPSGAPVWTHNTTL